MDYFPHDTKAMSDDKLLALRLMEGLEAVAAYWVVLEKIYADERPIDVSETKVGSSAEAMSVSYRLGVGFDKLREYVFAMERTGLLYRVDCEGDVFMSERAQEQINTLEKKRETARQNGKNGGRKPEGNQCRSRKETKVGSNRKPKSAAYKTLNGIGFDKQNLYQESGVAEATEAAPPASLPVCPMCESTIKFDTANMTWSCPICGDVKEPKFKQEVA